MEYYFKEFCFLNNDEVKLILKWRNHESVRKWMFNTNIISPSEHQHFLISLKSDKSKKYWLVLKGSDPVGVTSLINIKFGDAEWGYYIQPELHESSISVEFYYFTLEFIFEKLNFTRIYGYELPGNKGAASLNSLFGFSKERHELSLNGMDKEVQFRELLKDKWLLQKNSPSVTKILYYLKNRE